MRWLMHLQRVGLLGDVTGDDVGDIWLFEAVGVQGERLQAAEKHTPPLLTPPECGKLDHRQRCRFRCCLAPRWRRSLLTAFGGNCQGISDKKSCSQVFLRPLTIGKVAIRRSPEQGSTKPTEPAQRPRRSRSGAVGGGRKRRQRRGTKAKGGRIPTKGAADKRTNPGHAPSRAARKTSQNFLLCERLSPQTSHNINFATNQYTFSRRRVFGRR